MRLFYVLFLLCVLSSCSKNTENTADTPLKIWFDQPTQQWDRGLPIGNGSLGAMFYGSPAFEKIGLNEDTIWSGKKHYDRDREEGHRYISAARQLLWQERYLDAEKLVEEQVLAERFPSGSHSYQMLGNLWIERQGFEQAENYHRELDLNKALVTTRYEKDGVRYVRESFSSFPNQVMVIKYSADADQKISFYAQVERTEDTLVELFGNRIHFSEHVGHGVGVKFHSIVDFEVKGGETSRQDGKLQISNADEVVVRIVAASDYREANPRAKSEENLAAALKLSYSELKDAHIADYRSLFKRVDFKISNSDGADLPTDVRLQKVIDSKTESAIDTEAESTTESATDNYLTQLQYQFGRYLLISSSRPGTMPANLQGIWADGLQPAWNSDYHININIQMNYWMAEMTNLAELHRPFLEFIGGLREMGRITARKTYNSGGFVAHHTSDGWHSTAGFGKARYGMWPLGAAWACQHLYTHYEYTHDLEYLETHAYPIMKEAAEFFVDYMILDPDTGWLISGPSTSPENNLLSPAGEEATISLSPTMDRSIILELFRNVVAAAEILQIDEDFRAVLNSKIRLIQPLKIGSDGRLMEWAKEYGESQPGHRHISHLYALHPSNQISQTKTPALFEAAKKTIRYRLENGGGHTGWSQAWIINFYARLLEPQKAYEAIEALQRKSTLPNLLDLHPPFQIDGNFGVVSGITEMLMQSHNDEVHVLPALPAQWSSGFIHGIVARKGFELDIDWEGGELKSLVLYSKLGERLDLRYGDKLVSLETSKGEVLKFNSQLLRI